MFLYRSSLSLLEGVAAVSQVQELESPAPGEGRVGEVWEVHHHHSLLDRELQLDDAGAPGDDVGAPLGGDLQCQPSAPTLPEEKSRPLHFQQECHKDRRTLCNSVKRCV